MGGGYDRPYNICASKEHILEVGLVRLLDMWRDEEGIKKNCKFLAEQLGSL